MEPSLITGNRMGTLTIKIANTTGLKMTLETILTIFIPFSAVCYTLREIPHIWSKSTTYKMNFKLGRWWTDASPRPNRNTVNVIWADAYHFFGNLPRIILSLIILYYYGIAYFSTALMLWFCLRTIVLNTLVTREVTG